MLDSHNSSISKQLFWIIVNQLSIDENIASMLQDLVDLILKSNIEIIDYKFRNVYEKNLVQILPSSFLSPQLLILQFLPSNPRELWNQIPIQTKMHTMLVI